jgi:hypothetical protein
LEEARRNPDLNPFQNLFVLRDQVVMMTVSSELIGVTGLLPA